MRIIVEIPAPLRQFSSGASQIELIDVPRLADAIARISEIHPVLARNVISADGEFYDFVGIFVNRRSLGGQRSQDVAFSDGDVVSLVPAMAGG